ncbi:MAG: MFS transporter [Clostridia bacterium]|nr:MFS transporter [Clostridia bacterium]
MKKINELFPKSKWLILLLFGTVGQLAWSVENMYFNLFVFDTIAPNLDTVTLMVQLSGITATVVTLIAGVISDKVGNRRSFIGWGYAVWGVTVALFGCLSPELVASVFNTDATQSIAVALTLAIIGDCVMTLFGSTSNDAAFNAWVTDNTRSEIRGRIESIISILPLIAMLIVAGGFGILVSLVGYKWLFIGLGAVISAVGIVGIFIIRDDPGMERSGTLGDILYGFRPSVIKAYAPLYLTLIVVLIYGVATQVFMPYLIIYMKTYLGFSVIEYSVVFGAAIILGAAVNIKLGALSDRVSKVKLLYVAAAVMSLGLFGMYLAPAGNKTVALLVFGISGFVMICGNIFLGALTGSTVRDYTPEGAVGKLQGVRMVFSVLIPMLIGPAIGNGINKLRGIRLEDVVEDVGADIMTTEYCPAPEIFLVGALVLLLIAAAVPLLDRAVRKFGK